MSKQPVYIVNPPVGLGKTHWILHFIKENKLRAVILSPTHKLGTEICDRFGGCAIQIRGRETLVDEKHLSCPHDLQIRENGKLGRDTFRSFCSKKHGICASKGACCYLKQFEAMPSHQVVILTHHHLNFSAERWDMILKDRDVVVFDENPLQAYRKRESLKLSELETLKRCLNAIGDSQNIISRWIDPIRNAIASHSMKPSCIGSHLSVDEVIRDVNNWFRIKSPNTRNVLSILRHAAHQNATFQVNTCTSGDPMASFILHGHFPKDIPVFILDATGVVDDYQIALGDKYECKGINPCKKHRVEKSVLIRQCVSGAYPVVSLLKKDHSALSGTGERMLKYIQEHTDGIDDYAIISALKVEECLRPFFPSKKLFHYNDLRGLNHLSGCERLFVLGVQMWSYLDLVEQAETIFGKWITRSFANNEVNWPKEFEEISYAGNSKISVKALCPKNNFVNACFRMFIVGEVEQGIGRARPYSPFTSGARREIHVLTNVPTSFEIDEIFELCEQPATIDDRFEELVNHAEKLLDAHCSFTAKDICKDPRFNKTYFGRKKEELRRRLNLTVIKGSKNKSIFKRLR